MIAPRRDSRRSNRAQSPCVVLLWGGDPDRSNDTHIARFAARSQSCAAGDFGQFPLLRRLVFSAAISPVPFAFQSPRSCRPSIRAMGEITRFMHGTERTSQRALTAQGDLERNGTYETGERKGA